MYVVYVLEQSGNPLMPTRRFGHVRRLLKSGMAKAVSTKPFIVRLQYASSSVRQPLHGATDPGRTNIGEAVINDKGEVVYAAHVSSRNKEVPKLMENRAGHRNASRDDDNASLCTFTSGKRYNCDLSASYNIGARYFIRELLKPLPVTTRRHLEAEVPPIAKRTTCTLSTLSGLSAALSAPRRKQLSSAPYRAGAVRLPKGASAPF